MILKKKSYIVLKELKKGNLTLGLGSVCVGDMVSVAMQEIGADTQEIVRKAQEREEKFRVVSLE